MISADEEYYAKVKIKYNKKLLRLEQENENRIDKITMYEYNIKLYEKELEG